MATNEVERVDIPQEESEETQEIQILDPDQEELGKYFKE